MSELHSAAYHGELDWVENCLKGGLDPNARDDSGWTPLHWAASMGLVEGD
jgi:ankyrin repeat protein